MHLDVHAMKYVHKNANQSYHISVIFHATAFQDGEIGQTFN